MVSSQQPQSQQLQTVGTLACDRPRSESECQQAIEVVQTVWQDEKQWIVDACSDLPSMDASEDHLVWLVARDQGQAVGVVRLQFDIPLVAPEGVQIDLLPGLQYQKGGPYRVAEVGRFMVIPSHRRSPRAVLCLMRGLIETSVRRGCTHLLTSVFVDDPHTPLGFHQRVLGFERIGKIRRAAQPAGTSAQESELAILALDLGRTFERSQRSGNQVIGRLVAGLEEQFAGLPEAQPLFRC